MELSDFAQTILFGTDLADKLVDPQDFTDLSPHVPFAAPIAPGRPLGLELSPTKSKSRTVFPSAHALKNPTSRGIVLHFFANHELLALELMALALLRFPMAPVGFRRGLAHTMVEEQKHLRLYLTRMRELGVDFGSVAVNRYFWDSLQDMQSPLDYVVRMSLTFEQANLDYSLYFHKLFAELGDKPTADIMEVVYREEIGHVRHGVQWFDKLQPEAPKHNDWDLYCAQLVPPLTPARAKGLGFDYAARRAAGLSETFIRELSVYGHSKGKPPVVFHFNPGCEDEIASTRQTSTVIDEHSPKPRVHYTPTKILQTLGQDLAGLMLFIAGRDDVIIANPPPNREQRERLQAAGFMNPQYAASLSELKSRQLHRYEPWAQTPHAAQITDVAKLNFQVKPNTPPDLQVFSKVWSTRLAEQQAWFTGSVCRDLPAIHAALQSIWLQHERAVIKAPYGASGRHMLHLQARGSETISINQQRWLEKTLLQQGELIVEPWLPRVLDLSVQLQVGATNPVLGITRLLNDARGQYLGHQLGRRFADLDPQLLRFLYETKSDAREKTEQMSCFAQLEHAGKVVAEHLLAAGYRGPAGMDAFVYAVQAASQESAQNGYALRPMCEINPRYTMGRLALELGRHVAPKTSAVWLHLNQKHIQQLGYQDFCGFATEMRGRYPLQKRHGMMENGFLATNDPENAQVVLSCLFLGEAFNHDGIQSLLK